MSIISQFLDYLDTQTGNAKTEVKEELINVSNTTSPLVRSSDTERAIPPGRVSVPEYSDDLLNKMSAEVDFVTPEFVQDIIPVIRKLTKTNADVGSVYNDLIRLTNTGHKISFDQSLPPEQVSKMRKHLVRVSKKWGSGTSGFNGLIDKLIGQIWVSGALSAETVPNRNLTGIQNIVLVNPENIKFKYNKPESRYEPYQKVNGYLKNILNNNTVKLNTDTYSYFGILGDTDSPYGIPPFITALESLAVQKEMRKNINHIMKQLGLLGYLEVKLEKPDQRPGESDKTFLGRLEGLLKQTKEQVIQGFSDGVVVGFNEDHEFEFHATAKNLQGVGDIFNQNETQVANGLKTSPTFIGQSSLGSETAISIIFSKLLSQLTNIHELLSAFIQRAYLLELTLEGFDLKADQISIIFKPSTITDDLKYWQAKEIKQRVLHKLRVDGIIDQEQYAEEMNYDKAAEKEPIVPFEDQDGKGTKDQESKEKREKDKDTSDRKSRTKDKANPKRKDADTKIR